MPKLLVESGGTAPKKNGARWDAVIAVPGQGSSGFYSEDLFRRDGAAAFPPGTKSFVGHPADRTNPKRNPKDEIGVFHNGGHFDESQQLFVGELTVHPHWEEFVDAVAPSNGLSMFVYGDTDDSGNVTALTPHKFNSVDLVSYAGLENSGLVAKLYEDAIAHSPKPGVTSAQDIPKEGHMDPKTEAALVALAESLPVLVTFITESKTKADAKALAEASAKPVETVVEEAVTAYDEKVALIEAAELLPTQIKALRAEAVLGRDVVPLIESAKAVRDEAKGAKAPATTTIAGLPVGRALTEDADADASNYAVPGWEGKK